MDAPLPPVPLRKGRPSPRGLTLIEMMIVLLIVSLICTLAVMLLSRGRILANEGAAISALRLIRMGEQRFFLEHNDYAELQELIDEDLVGGLDESYKGYRIRVIPDAPDGWYAVAVPISYDSSGNKSFYVDGSGIIRELDTGGNDWPDPNSASSWDRVE